MEVNITWTRSKHLNGDWFFGPSKYRVHRETGTKDGYPITFKPLWSGTALATLVLKIPSTNDILQYELKGIGTDPLSADHIILKCDVHQKHTHEVTLENKDEYADLTFNVESDIPNFFGDEKIVLKPLMTKKYKFVICPILAGTYLGQLTFTEDTQSKNKKIIWYTLELQIRRPPAKKKITLTSYIRQGISFEIELENPLYEIIVFKVYIEGKGLLGPD